MTENKRFTECDDGTYCLVDNGKGLEYDEVISLLNALHEENEQLKIQNELLSDELEQCKAVIDKRWKEYLDKKGDVE